MGHDQGVNTLATAVGDEKSREILGPRFEAGI